ncbi:MAG: hypothetical protein H6978_07480 [Gammaproteobacteria bacterium]|nr:hypothetical protein [Gammaproteobacteria bacterium]
MIRKQIALAAAVALSFPAVIWALGLGPLQTNSALNEPYNARIELLGMTANDFDTLKIELADQDQFQRAGIPFTEDLLNLRFEVVENPSGSDYIAISTREPVREPFLNFLLELNWASGRMVREYTVLLDPPVQLTRRPSSSASATASRAPVQPATPRSAPAATRTYDGSDYAVQRGDTLWSIASRTMPAGANSVQQMMVALQTANPDAFIDGNINKLRSGAVLRIPDANAVADISRAQALDEVRRQQQQWLGSREIDTPSTAARPIGAAARSSATTSTPNSGARLQIVAPSDEGGGTAGGASREDLTVAQRENDELRAKIAEAEEIIDLLQRQVDIKDNELATLQSQLGSDSTDADEPVSTDEPAETVARTPAVEPAPEPEPEAEKPVTPVATRPATPPPAPAEKGLLETIGDMVPGGLITLGAGLVLIAAGIAALLLRSSRRNDDEPAFEMRPAVAKPAPKSPSEEAAGDDVDEAMSTVPGTDAEDFTATLDSLEAHGETSPDMVSTIEASHDELSSATVEVDPLEEVNVYLAYERFDQAEELVRKAIAANPDEHNYKLRLLEVFYSANDKKAYEEAARDLHDAVDGSGPLWDSAVAMWQEMSPNRAMFEEVTDFNKTGVYAAGAAAAGAAAKTFVDITGDDAQADGDLTESTAVGLATEAMDDVGSDLDFDLSNTTDMADSGTVDFTATEHELDQADIQTIIEQPAESVADEPDGIFDITAGGDESAEDVFDISGGVESPVEPVDFQATIADESGAAIDDPLDVTTSGQLSPEDHSDLLNVTSPGAAADEDMLDITSSQFGDTQDGLDLSSRQEETELPRFDVSDTVAPLFDADEAAGETVAAASETVASLEDLAETAADMEGTTDEMVLDFDIGEIADTDSAEDTVAVLGDDDFDLALETTGNLEEIEAERLGASTEGELDFDLTVDEDTGGMEDSLAGASTDLDLTLDGDDDELPDLSLHGGELDAIVGSPAESAANLEDDLVTTDSAADELDSEFDLSLEDTSELSELAIEETVELPRMGSVAAADDDGIEFDDDETSLEELTKSMEDTVSGLGGVGAELDVSMDIDAALNEEHALELPDDGELDAQLSDEDEADTKLNLAKAYIELGDKDGARAILDEVMRDGTSAQRSEARSLRDQLA